MSERVKLLICILNNFPERQWIRRYEHVFQIAENIAESLLNGDIDAAESWQILYITSS